MKKIVKVLDDYTQITLGLFMCALGWTAFLIPSNIVGGGVSGIATLIYFVSDIPVGIMNFGLNIVIIGLAFKIMGPQFGIKTIYGVIVLSVFLTVLQPLFTSPLVNDSVLACVAGGLLNGAGMGLAFTKGGNPGGFSTVALMVNKYRNISPGRIIMMLDVVVISCSYFVFQSIEIIIYGLATMAVYSYSSDMVLSGSRASVQLMILSSKYDEIGHEIQKISQHGITTWQGKGFHSKNDVTVMFLMVRRQELGSIMQVIKRNDPDAFVSQGKVTGIFGPGFETIKK